VHRKNEYEDAFAFGEAAHPPPGRAQTPAAPRVDADIDAIRELRDRIRRLWMNLAAPSREELGVRLELLRAAADRRDTDSKPVREALQQVLLTVGTGVLATLSEPTRQRLAALTGIALPGHGASADRTDGAARRPAQPASSPESGGDG
jgi:hypothetical protein